MVTQELADTIAATVESLGIDETVIGRLRADHPGIHFTYCIDDDIPNHEPVLECPGFNLYLVDGRDHCLCLTQNYEQASGFVVAEIIND
ncbi:DUF6129 family protein [Methylotuvimicrobium buryatense]|uniref:DUF6129 domain-containing protein n=1 Tax=Methylotuvimicrobium buryatense TaxID=95641 RepID=A0A4P9UQP9_METBY|nr:DUF6129 family protein [Methylotuvimicrobium buryatense]QCW83772.1 hypothetical protein EQU24_17095 [Methylotuvimicrobium buryatense]